MQASPTSQAAPAATSHAIPKWLDPATARAYFDYIKGGDALVEVRIPKAYGLRAGDRAFACGGWFDSFDALQEQLTSQIGDYDGGIYVTLNTIHDGLLARKNGHNRLTKRDDTTKDAEITRRKFLVIDLDPKRPSNISSTAAEHAAAEARAKEIGAFLTGRGWPHPMFCDSGNGFHLVYGIDLPTADGDLVKNTLLALATLFPPAGADQPGAVPVEVDGTMYNPSRICKLVGTAAKKGGSTPERPWRMSRIVWAPQTGDLIVVSADQLSALVALAPPSQPAKPFAAPPAAGSHQPFTPPANNPSNNGLTGTAFIEDFCARHDLRVKGPKPWQAGGSIWTLLTDPITSFNDGSCFIGVQANGAYFAGCHHNSAKWGWQELCAALGEQRGNPALRELDEQFSPYDGHVNLAGLMEEAQTGKKASKAAASTPKAPVATSNTPPHPAKSPAPASAPAAPPHPVQAAGPEHRPEGAPTTKKFATIQGIAQEFLNATLIPCALTGLNTVQGLRIWRQNIYLRVGPSGEVLPHYHLVGDKEFNSRVRTAAANWRRLKAKGSEPLDLTRKVVGDIRAAVIESADTWADDRLEAPMWLGERSPWEDLRETALFADGVLDMETGEKFPHSPFFFQTYSFECAAPSIPMGRAAPEPREFIRWAREDLFQGDEDALRLLQEWGGYCLTGRADLQKGMMIIGPPASGKSALLDLMGRLYGDAAVGLDLQSIVEQHTLCGCIGKRLLTIADARIDPANRDSAKLIEKLLQMIGQDQMSLARKYLGAYVGKFPCRIMMASNEVPQLKESSAAIGRRFLILTTTKTIPQHQQDPRLVDRMLTERAAIIGWFIEGWRRLKANNYQWTMVAASAESHADLRRAGGSVSAFIEDCMIISRVAESIAQNASQDGQDGQDEYGTDCDDIYLHYRDYCEAQGLSHKVSAIKFPRAFETASGLQRRHVRLPSGAWGVKFAGARYNTDGLDMAKRARDLMLRAATDSITRSVGGLGSGGMHNPADHIPHSEQQMRFTSWWDKA